MTRGWHMTWVAFILFAYFICVFNSYSGMCLCHSVRDDIKIRMLRFAFKCPIAPCHPDGGDERICGCICDCDCECDCDLVCPNDDAYSETLLYCFICSIYVITQYKKKINDKTR